MGQMTEDVPKPMLPVQGRPLLERVLETLASAGVREYLLVVGYRREVIQDHFRALPFDITYRVQERLDGTGSAARFGRDFAGSDPFLLTFGDILVPGTAYRRCASELTEQTSAVLGVKWMDDPWRGAAVYADGEGAVSKVIEKPPQGTSSTHWGSAGLYAMRPVVFEYLDRVTPSPRGEYELTSIFEMMLRDGLGVRIGPIEGDWRDVGTPEDLAAVNREA